VESSLAQFASEEVSLGEDKISFIPQRAAVKEIKFSKYQDYVFEINGLFLEAYYSRRWHLTQVSPIGGWRVWHRLHSTMSRLPHS
jgi:hypothetical protein